MSIRRCCFTVLLLFAAGFGGGRHVRAQSSSLYVQPKRPARQAPPRARRRRPAPAPPGNPARRRRPSRLAPAVAAAGFTVVARPQPRRFALHGLVTIIVRESSQADSTARLDTQKKSEFNDKLKDIPNFRLDKLLQFQLTPSDIPKPIALNLKADHKFQSDGEYSRRDTVTDRITAQIIDVKPNGLLVLEARKFVKTDQESLELVLTGTCRARDVSIDNTVLSTQLYDLHLNKQHKGELRRTTHKGLLTKVLEFVFNF